MNMTNEQLRQLSKMKKLIINGHKKFVCRNDRDYIEELLNIGITEEMAWQEILTLSAQNYVYDFKPIYLKNNEDALIFKKYINDYLVYIKIKIEKYNNIELTVCLSFHIDYN